MLNVPALEEHIREAMASEKVPALALAVVDREGVVYVNGFGVTANDSTGQTVTGETLFRIASTTKPFTATLIMRLAEEGLLDLDAPITSFAPTVRIGSPGDADSVTSRMLLSHLSGLPPGGEELGHLGRNALEEFTKQTLPNYELVAPPGTLYSYSNPGFSLLGFLAEKVTSESFETLMAQMVIEPLGLTSSFFDPLIALTYPTALAHRLDPQGRLTPIHTFFDEPAARPAGFLITNVIDLAAFARMLLNGGATAKGRLLSEKTVSEMLSPQADLLTASGASYGLGFFLRNSRGAKIAEHGGSMPTYETEFSLAPEPGLAVIVLANRPLTGELARLTDRLWGELLGRHKAGAKLDEPQLQKWDEAQFNAAIGTYVGGRRGLIRLLLEDGAPWLELNGRKAPLSFARPGVYVGTLGGGGTVSVGLARREASGPVNYLLIEGVVCKRTELSEVVPPDPTILRRLTGRYEGFDVIEVTLEEDRLVLVSQMHGARRMPCVPLGGLRFACDYGVVEFLEDAEGEIARMQVWDEFPLFRGQALTDSN